MLTKTPSWHFLSSIFMPNLDSLSLGLGPRHNNSRLFQLCYPKKSHPRLSLQTFLGDSPILGAGWASFVLVTGSCISCFFSTPLWPTCNQTLLTEGRTRETRDAHPPGRNSPKLNKCSPLCFFASFLVPDATHLFTRLIPPAPV